LGVEVQHRHLEALSSFGRKPELHAGSFGEAHAPMPAQADAHGDGIPDAQGQRELDLEVAAVPGEHRGNLPVVAGLDGDRDAFAPLRAHAVASSTPRAASDGKASRTRAEAPRVVTTVASHHK
jgi:hypothetical protein